MTISNKQKKVVEIIKPWFTSILLLPAIIFIVVNHPKFLPIDYVNLLIHEGGHGIFGIFGNKYIYTLGGTVMQVLIPGMFVVFYLINKKKATAQIFLIWLGQNILNISIYVSDARAQQLPLIGGKKVYHDWTYLLSEVGLLQQDIFIGQIFYFFGIAAFIVSLTLPLITRDYKSAKIDLGL
ncbi:MAG: hypothetical protein HYS25_16335 [Ignavibacteriales bacterium]|nr:hypothetical protein [Ignavibacteriales bacterium]